MCYYKYIPNQKEGNTMKKLISVLLCFAMIFATCAIGATAQISEESKISDYPVIIVPGYSATTLYIGDSFETGEKVWGLNMDLILERVLARIVDLGIGLGSVLTVGNAKLIAETLGEEMAVIFEKIRCNPDGSSAYDVKRKYDTAKKSNSAYMLENLKDGDPDERHEQDIAAAIAEYVGVENIYNFTSDFRMGAETCANLLHEFIQDVKKETGKDKVNIFCLSHGGQVTATYLSLYGHLGDVDNAVLTVPAIGGAGILYDAFNCDIDFDEECLLRFIEHGTMIEEDYNWLVKAQQLGFVDKVLEELIPHIFPLLGYWGSLWDFCPADKYDELKERLLDPVESAPLIEKSDRFHYEILPSIGEKLQACIDDYGMNITIISGTGNRIVTGLMENSDGIITTNASTGALCAPLGERFADGYVQKNPCNGKNKISPDMDIDASTSYLPDNTWFVDGLFHGMTFKDSYTSSLLLTTLLTDEITDVYSDPDYPQFRDTSNPSHAVYAEFNTADPGILDGNATSLIITNCSLINDVKLTAIHVDGLDINFNLEKVTLAPGESVEVPFEGTVPEISKKVFSITIYYNNGSVTPLGYRTQNFNISNGNAVDYEGGTVDASAKTPFDEIIGEGFAKILKNLGFYELFSMLYTLIFYSIVSIFNK